MTTVVIAEDYNESYDRLRIEVVEGNKITFDSWATFKPMHGRLKLEAPDKSIAYLGEFDSENGTFKKTVKILNPQNGTYIATFKIDNAEPRKYGITFKEIHPSTNTLTDVIISTDDIPDGFDEIITVRFDNTKLELIDACAITYEKELTSCTVSDWWMDIYSIGNGAVSFTVPRVKGQNLSEVLNVIRFRNLSVQPSYVMIITNLE